MSRLGIALTLSGLLCPALPAQVLLGYDGVGIEITEFTQAPGGVCPAPNPDGFVCDADVPPPCAALATLFPVGDPLHGDVTTDFVTDTTYITDGRVVRSYVGDMPCETPAPCTVVSGFIPNMVVPALGPITGLGCDSSDPSAGGGPVIFVTDGFQVVGLVPPAVCGDPPTLLYGPCPVPTAMQPVTDVSYDAFDRILWMISDIGNIAFMNPLVCVSGSPVSVAACGIAGPFTGLAYDISTPNPNPQNNSAWVCNAAGEVAYVETYTGLPGAGTFAGPIGCTTGPEPLVGLAVAYRGVNYGTSRDVATLESFGQSTSPSTTWGIDVIDAPATGASFLIMNFSVPGPGFLCPSVGGVGTDLWVDPSPPGVVFTLPPLGPGCTSIPLPIPSGVLLGTNVFLQLVFMDGGPPAVDATPGLACTIGFY